MAPRKTAAAPRVPEPVARAIPQLQHTTGIGHNRPPPTAIGRDGKPIYLDGNYDPTDFFAVAKTVEPPGWIYEWKRETIYNQPDLGYQAQLRHKGHWTEVQHETHPGVFGAINATGAVRHEGMILMERPMEVHEHFKMLEKQKADAKITDAKNSHGLGRSAPGGVDPNTARARQASFVKTQRVAVEDAPRPQYNYDPTAID